jgi:hypothetical protein
LFPGSSSAVAWCAAGYCRDDLLAISRCVSRGWELWVFGTIVLVLCLIKSVLVLCLIIVLV